MGVNEGLLVCISLPLVVEQNVVTLSDTMLMNIIKYIVTKVDFSSITFVESFQLSEV